MSTCLSALRHFRLECRLYKYFADAEATALAAARELPSLAARHRLVALTLAGVRL